MLPEQQHPSSRAFNPRPPKHSSRSGNSAVGRSRRSAGPGLCPRKSKDGRPTSGCPSLPAALQRPPSSRGMLGIMAEARPGAGKHHRGGGGKHRGSRRLAAAAPLAGAALCGALLLFALCRMGGSDDGELGDDLRAYADDPGALPGGDGGGRATWLSAAGLWAEEHVHHVRLRPGMGGGCLMCVHAAQSAASACHARLRWEGQRQLPPGLPTHLPSLPTAAPRSAAPACQGQPLPAAQRLPRAALLLAAPAPPAHSSAVRLQCGCAPRGRVWAGRRLVAVGEPGG